MRYVMTIEINRPIDEVWAWTADLFNTPRLRGMALRARQTSSGPISVGSTYEMRAIVLGFETVIVGEVTEWDPPHASTVTASGRPVKSFKVRETFEPTTTGTRMVRDLQFELPMALRVLWPAIGPLVLRRWRSATANIKRLIESSPSRLAQPARVASIGIETHLTFMFTDIVESTALIGVIGDPAWRDLRRWHDATLRTHFQRHSGREVDHAGDGFLVVFDVAAAAVGCAIEIQRSLVEHRRVTGFAPSVRIGLHSGKVHRDGSAFAGAALHAASRVAAAAEAGQILATATTIQEAAAATRALPVEMKLRGVEGTVSVAVIPY
jgi:class 3 adenylate cyclase